MTKDVVVFVPVKNCAIWLLRFLQEINKLKDINRIVFCYGQSNDPTLTILKTWMQHTKHYVQIFEEPRLGGAKSSAEIAGIYREFQQIMKEGDEEYALLLDADIMRMQTNLVPKLKNLDKDIIAPFVWTLFHQPPQFYAIYTFRLKGNRFHPFKPPTGGGKPFQVDSVGTCILLKREPFLEVEYQDPYPHIKFCNAARQKGYEVWADPRTTVQHVDLIRFGIVHEQLEVIKARQRGETELGQYIDRTPFIKDGGEIIDLDRLAYELTSTYVWGNGE